MSLNNNDPIVAWADLTTNSNDFSQAVSGNRPQYKSSSYAGHASVSFDGVDDYLSSSYVPATGSSPRTVVAVYRPQHNSGNSSVLYSWGWNNSYGQCFGLGVSTPYSLDPYTMTFYTNESQGEQGSFWQKAEYNQVHLSILEYDGTDAVHYLNGKTSRSYTKSIDTRNNNPLNIGRFALGGGHFKGDLFELAVFQSSTAGLSREKLECYYGRKFNIKIQNSLECGQAAPVFFADSRTSLKAGSATTLQVSGGTVPLHFEITSGEGTINPSSGEFTAPLTNGFTTVKVTDSFGDDDEITIATHSFSNPLSWLDLDQTSNYSDNDPVEFIRDASGNENHFIQYTSALKPTYKANAQNGKPSLSFTGAHYLQAALKAPIGSADRTFVFVTKNSTEGTILGYGGNEYCGNIFQFYFNTGTNFLSLSRNCGVHASSATISSDAKIIVVQMDSGTLKMFQDGTQVFSDSSPTVSTSTEVSVKLGVSWDRTTGFYTGEILEFMTFDSALDTTDRQAVESYLSGKFAITLP